MELWTLNRKSTNLPYYKTYIQYRFLSAVASYIEKMSDHVLNDKSSNDYQIVHKRIHMNSAKWQLRRCISLHNDLNSGVSLISVTYIEHAQLTVGAHITLRAWSQ